MRCLLNDVGEFVGEQVTANGCTTLELRRRLAGEAFAHTAAYDRVIQLNPQNTTAWYQKGQILSQMAKYQSAIDSLPEGYRVAFVLREVDGLSTAEAAECLSITEDALKVRLHRAHMALRVLVAARLGEAVKQVYGFEAPRCNRIVAAVLARIG